MNSETNILFTSAGRRVELLRAFRLAYEQLGLAGKIVAIDVDPMASALRFADRPHVVPSLDSPDYLPALQEIVRSEGVSAIFPLIDPDIPLLAVHRAQLEACGARVAVVAPAAADIVGDKLLTCKFFRENGVATPRTWVPSEIAPGEVPYPVIIKPRAGSASHHVFRVENEEQFEFFSRYVHDPIVQELVTGPEITNDVVCDLDGNLLSIVSRQRIRVHGGEVLIGKTIFDQRILDDCVTIARALPAIGPITVQCMMSQRGHLFTEINARFGGGAPLGFAAGVESPKWLLASMAGIKTLIAPLGQYQCNLCLTRYTESLFFNDE